MLEIYDACNQATSADFAHEVIRGLPFRIRLVQTDNGTEFGSKFHWHLEELDIRHVRIRPRTPRLNGKVERSHRIDDDQFYRLLDKDASATTSTSPTRVRECRPHGGLGGQTPFECFPEHTKKWAREALLPRS